MHFHGRSFTRVESGTAMCAVMLASTRAVAGGSAGGFVSEPSGRVRRRHRHDDGEAFSWDCGPSEEKAKGVGKTGEG